SSFVRFPSPSEDTQAPTAPTNLTATGALGRAALSWTASPANARVTKYDVYRSTTQGFTPDVTNRIAQPTTTGYCDTGLSSGTYYYRLKDEDAAGNLSAASGEASAVVTSDTTQPTVSVTAPASGATVSA